MYGQIVKNHISLGLKKKLFVSCNSLKKIRVVGSVKKKLHYFFGQKCVFCMFYVD